MVDKATAERKKKISSSFSSLLLKVLHPGSLCDWTRCTKAWLRWMRESAVVRVERWSPSHSNWTHQGHHQQMNLFSAVHNVSNSFLFSSKTKSTLFTVSQHWARISGNHSAGQRRASTLLRRYLWHWLKNGFLQFEENVNTKGERDGGSEQEEVGEEKEERRPKIYVQTKVSSSSSVWMELYTERIWLNVKLKGFAVTQNNTEKYENHQCSRSEGDTVCRMVSSAYTVMFEMDCTRLQSLHRLMLFFYLCHSARTLGQCGTSQVPESGLQLAQRCGTFYSGSILPVVGLLKAEFP